MAIAAKSASFKQYVSHGSAKIVFAGSGSGDQNQKYLCKNWNAQNGMPCAMDIKA